MSVVTPKAVVKARIDIQTQDPSKSPITNPGGEYRRFKFYQNTAEQSRVITQQ